MKRVWSSVTCLADDPWNLETRSNKRRTPGDLSQTNNKHTISTHLMHREISNKRSNQRVQLKNPGCKRIESNKASKVGTRERTTWFRNLKLGQNFTVAKLCESWLVGTAVSRWNSRRLNHLIPINEREDKLERRSDLRSRSRNKSDEKKKKNG